MIMGGITLKMGHDLQEKIEAVEESCHEYKKAVQLFSNSPVEKIQCLNKLVSSKINSGTFMNNKNFFFFCCHQILTRIQSLNR